MTDGGPPPGMSFPQKIHTDDEDFVIELEDSMSSPPDGYGMDDRSRCKRRKRCGQCGPCQVKENCMKCHFCIRKDVLKQTCIYRKCVYLRSKPKPYSRSHQGSQERGRLSPQRSSPAVKSPPSSGQSSMQAFSEQGIPMPEPRPENLFFPPHLPHQQPIGSLQNNGYTSPPNPILGRGPPTPLQAASNSSVNMNMQMNITPQLQNHAASPPSQKLSEQSSPLVPQPVNSPPSALAGIPPNSSCISHIPAIPPVMPAIPPVLTMPSSSLAGMPSMPTISNMANMNERAINEFRHPDQLSLPPHHPHHFSSVHTHPHLHREANLFGDPSRVPPHVNYQNHVDPLSRGPTDSSCMYHPGLPYSMQGHYQPSGPSFLSGPAEISPFRSNFLNSFPPGYTYPPDRYREAAAGFGSLPFSRLGMSSSTSFPQYPSQGTGYGMGNTFSNQYSPYNSQHGCPKNGSRPPVTPNTDDVKVLQEGYKNCEIRCETDSPDGTELHRSDTEVQQEGVKLPKRKSTPVNGSKSSESVLIKMEKKDDSDTYDGFKDSLPSGMEHLRLWYDFFSQRQMEANRGPQALSWSPWRSTMFSPRHDDARSRASTSTLSSDFECEIGIDDHQVNALIRSDGCNSIEIEIDNKSITGSEDPLPRKLASRSSALSDSYDRHVRPLSRRSAGGTNSRLLSPRPWDSYHSGEHSIDKGSYGSDMMTDKETLLRLNRKRAIPKKTFLSELVCVRQDLGDEGVVQLELPGSKVTIENIVLNDEMLTKSSNVEELKAYLRQRSH